MPYKSLKDINPALKGIKPPVTLEQANHIADMADAIESDDGADNPWAVAISNFKKEFVVRGGKWIKRKQTEGDKSILEQTVEALWNAMNNKDTEDDETLGEAVWNTKYINDLPDSSFAVIVPGGKKDDTGKTVPRGLRKLPYKDETGNIDLAHLRNALSRLPQMKGVAEGLKQKALKLLQTVAKKALKTYQDEEREELLAALAISNVMTEFDWSVDQMLSIVRDAFYALFHYPPDQTISYWIRDVYYEHPEYGTCVIVKSNTDGELYSVDYTFSDDGGVQFSSEWREVVLAYKYAESGVNVETFNVNTEEAGKRLNSKQLEALKSANEVIGQILSWAKYDDEEPEDEEVIENAEPEAQELTESESGHVISLAETEGKKTPLYMDVVIIEPGFGNQRDNHYYPREMLEIYAEAFSGAKMFATDHRQDEKSVGTWVSTIKRVKGFTDTGAPIAEVVVHKDWFAEDVRNLSDAGMIDRMECSILAVGTAKKGKVDGKEAMVVETIDAVSSVDWVTRAGAGGHALGISESEVNTMTDDKKKEGVIIEGEPEKVKITEGVDETPDTAPEKLTKEMVSEALGKTNLPEVSKTRLALAEYADDAALQTVISAEIEYVKSISGSGKPFEQGSTTAPVKFDEQAYSTSIEKILEKYGVK